MRRMLVLLILAAPCLPGCSEPPRMDTRSAAGLRTSTGEVAKSLSGEDAKRFQSAMGLITAVGLWERNPALFAQALALGPTPISPPSGGVMARAHGLTADEVIALADQLAAETQRIHGLTADDVMALADKVVAQTRARREAAGAAYGRAAQAQQAEEAVALRTEAAYFPNFQVSLKAAYFSRIEVVGGAQAEKGSRPSLGGAFVRVDGEVKNLGDKTLDKVELIFTLLDIGGKPLAGQSHRVVLIEFGRDGALTPFKPTDARVFTRIIERPPLEWAGKVEARITAVRFAAPK